MATQKKTKRKRISQSKTRQKKTSKRTSPKQVRRSSYEFSIEQRARRIAFSLIYALFALIVGLGIFNQAGKAGEVITTLLKTLTGVGIYILPLLFLGLAINRVRFTERSRVNIARGISLFILLLSTLGVFETLGDKIGGGGILGQVISGPLVSLFDTVAGVLIMFVLILITSIITFKWYPSLSLLRAFRETDDDYPEYEDEGEVVQKVAVTGIDGVDSLTTKKPLSKNKNPQRSPAPEDKEASTPKEALKPIATKIITSDRNNIENKKPDDKKIDSKKDTSALIIGSAESSMPSAYIHPPLSLLPKSSGKSGVDNIEASAQTIVQTLDNFNIQVTMDEISVGPTVTRFAMKPAVGTKLSKIKGLQSELALALAAHPLRIEAPIPGKSLIGIEIPNKKKTVVGLGSMLATDEFKNSKKPLLVSLGKGVSGKEEYANMAKMPHVLIAGATGAGKSVTVHNIILSLIYANGPEAVRLMMIDPKRVELTLYNKIPHLLTPVIKDARKAILALKWATTEMDRRYDVLENNKVRDIASYHSSIVEPAYAKAKKDKDTEPENPLPERMPYIVIIIDEMADLMQLYPRELEASIVRLAQMSRAVGIHLLLSTQRPSVNVITGLIKANIPARLALRVSSSIDSRTILDTSGAEVLLGAGDMLWKGGDMNKPARIQCAWVSEDDIKKIVDTIIKQNRGETYDSIDLPDRFEASGAIAGGSIDNDDEQDEFFGEAKDIVIQSKKASTSYLQRKLRIGYSRAARLMDSLEDAGVIGPSNGSKAREVLIAESEEPEYPDDPDGGMLPAADAISGNTNEEEGTEDF